MSTLAILTADVCPKMIVAEDSAQPVGILTERELIEYLSLNARIPNLPLKDVLGSRLKETRMKP